MLEENHFSVMDREKTLHSNLARSLIKPLVTIFETNFTQLVTQPTHKGGNVLNLIFSNFNDSDILCIEKHL